MYSNQRASVVFAAFDYMLLSHCLLLSHYCDAIGDPSSHVLLFKYLATAN